MKKVYFTLAVFIISMPSFAQEGVDLDDINLDIDQSKVNQILDLFSFTLSAGSGSINNSQISSVALGEMNILYKYSDRVALGLSTMGNLSGCVTGYTNAEGQFEPLNDGDDDLYEEEEIDDGDEDETEDCDADEVSNLMATATIYVSDNIPVFIQAAAGYSFSSNAPSVSAFVGYNKKLFQDLGIVGGVRFSNVFVSKPLDAVSFSTHNIRAELGFTWNY